MVVTQPVGHLHAPGKVTHAVVMAASRLSTLDSHGVPKCLVHVGERPLIHHVLQQLYRAGVAHVVVTLGYKAPEIQQYLEANNIFPGMSIRFAVISEAVWAAKGHAAALLEAKALFPEDQPVLLSAADHIYHPELMARMAASEFVDGCEAYALVEEDMEGMVGLPGSSYQVYFDRETRQVKAVSQGAQPPQEAAEGLVASLFAARPSLWRYLERVALERPYFTLSEALREMSKEGKVRAVSTGGLTWFSIETPESLQYALDKHDRLEATSWLRLQSAKSSKLSGHSDANQQLVPRGKGAQHSSFHNGGDWNEFSVDKWRSAVFTQGAFFSQLYKDSHQFALDAVERLGGKEQVSLIEVGSGTGEFIMPLCPSVSAAVGLELNTQFVNWCNSRIQPHDHGLVKFIAGDACKLVDIMEQEAPKQLWNTQRLVCCVGNTLGIMPPHVKDLALRQMALLAGHQGLVLIVYWNAAVFPEAVREFYGKNPQLCGSFSDEHVDYDNTTLSTPSGYVTHWTGVDEAKRVLAKYHLEEILVEERGKGVLVLGRLRANNNHNQTEELSTC